MKKIIACVSDLYDALNESNIQLSNKQKDSVVSAIYPSIEYSRVEAYKQGKVSVEEKKQNY